MPQFDFTTLFSVTISVAICWSVYYSFFSVNLLSEIVVLSKFRTKLSETGVNSSIKNLSLPSVFIYKSIVKV